MKKKIWKIVMWFVGIVIVIIAILLFLGIYGQRIDNYFMAIQQEKMLAEGQKRAAEILELQKNDTYGGKTPEETLDLYIKALKEGNIELASKYYEISMDNIELQSKELDNLKAIITRDGSLSLVIDEAEKIKNLGIKKILSGGGVSFLYNFVNDKEITSTSTVSREEIVTIIPAGTSLETGNALKLNPYTKVWKIIQ